MIPPMKPLSLTLNCRAAFSPLKVRKKCAIEFCSLSKTAGFTGTRCSYTIVPQELVFKASNGEEMSVNAMWKRRQTTKFNGVLLILYKKGLQRFSPGKVWRSAVKISLTIRKTLKSSLMSSLKGIRFFGGKNSPYIWFECPNGMDSWDFF